MIAVNYWTKVNHWGCNWMQSTNQNSETRGKPRLILLCLVLYLPRQNLCTKSVQWSDCPVSSQEHCSTKPNQLNTFDTEQSIKSFSNELRDMLCCNANIFCRLHLNGFPVTHHFPASRFRCREGDGHYDTRRGRLYLNTDEIAYHPWNPKWRALDHWNSHLSQLSRSWVTTSALLQESTL